MGSYGPLPQSVWQSVLVPLSTNNTDVYLQVTPTSQSGLKGVYLMDLEVGSPNSQKQSVVVDTGSHLLWFTSKSCVVYPVLNEGYSSDKVDGMTCSPPQYGISFDQTQSTSWKKIGGYYNSGYGSDQSCGKHNNAYFWSETEYPFSSNMTNAGIYIYI